MEGARPWLARSTAVFVTAAAVVIFLDPRADAGQSATTFTVQAAVSASAQLTTNSLMFGSYSGVNDYASTTLQIQIPGASAANPTPVAVGFVGTGPGAGVFQLGNGSHRMSYDLCQDAACTLLFASGSPGPTFNVSSPSYAYTLYGLIPAGEPVPPSGVVMSQAISAFLSY